MSAYASEPSGEPVPSGYDHPENETSFWGQLARQAYERIVLGPGHRIIVDVGCGSGVALASLARRAAASVTLVGVDPAEDMRRLAAQRTAGLTQVEIRDGRFESLPLADASVDYLYSIWAFQWVRDPQQAVAELRRVLAARGDFDLWFAGVHTGRELARAAGEVLGRHVDL
ncbi:MAG: class I SAM-dependent methyltransferase, partial [Myxococcales bacterium]|nr:class I SAM-dependent methyltransferase [Myxococcales bacterium]